jgi:GAF domain-containing protein
VPLLRGGETIGAILIRRADVRPLGNRQVELVETFADQAVIAIENMRLFEAEQARTRELSEALEQQTATSGGSEHHLDFARRACAVSATRSNSPTRARCA